MFHDEVYERIVFSYRSVFSQGDALALSVYGLLQLYDDRGQVRRRVAHLEEAQGRGDEPLIVPSLRMGARNPRHLA